MSDSQGILATPLAVLASEDENGFIGEILRLVEEHRVGRIVIGLPRRLSGELGKQADKVTAFAEKLSCLVEERNLGELSIQLWDERLSTKAAQRLKDTARGQRSKPHLRQKRGTRDRNLAIKAEVDAIAAALILQGFLDSQRAGNGEES